jgi:hypothetical protein
MRHGPDRLIERAIRDAVKRFEGSPITQELLHDIAQEIELLMLHHLPPPLDVQVTCGSAPGQIDIAVTAAPDVPRPRRSPA